MRIFRVLAQEAGNLYNVAEVRGILLWSKS